MLSYVAKIFIITYFAFTLVSCTTEKINEAFLLHDDFSELSRGPLGSEVGAHTEYHFLPEAKPMGNWAVSTFRYNLPPSWYIQEFDGERSLFQKGVNPNNHWHPMVIAGSQFWGDYCYEAEVEQFNIEKRSGIAFRYQNDRCYYFFGFEKDVLKLLIVNHGIAFRKPDEKVLAARDFEVQLENKYKLTVECIEDRIRAKVNDVVYFEVNDSTFKYGKIALIADAPTAFFNVKVTTTKAHKKEIEQAVIKKHEEEKELIASNPKPVVYKKIRLGEFGTGRNLRFGDLNGDGEIDILLGQVINHGPTDRNSELSCLTAVTLDNAILWQIGKPDRWKSELTSDVASQIHDVNGDGKNEIVYCMNQELIIAEGNSGKVIKKIPTPETPGGKPLSSGQNSFPRILGDCIYFCDLHGTGSDQDIILKDRYRYVWAYDKDLNLLWHNTCNTGHYPYAYDTDGDGKDEILMGFTLFDDNGEKIWTLDDAVKDHADGVAITKLKEDADPVYICAASDEGMFYANLKGEIERHHYIGHVQNPAVANLRDDLPGLETVSVNFWGNQGIINLYNSDGDIYHSFEPNQYGSMCLPLNWTGWTEEFFILNANVDEGGAWDGYGRKVFAFPDDGHPDMCYAVMDITGDVRDEIVVWDTQELWVYTQDKIQIGKNIYQPIRNSLSNYSNYQATVSSPFE